MRLMPKNNQNPNQSPSQMKRNYYIKLILGRQKHLLFSIFDFKHITATDNIYKLYQKNNVF